MVLQLTSEQLNRILAQAQHTYPEECCGLLLGELQRGDSERSRLVEVWPTSNAWTAESEETMGGTSPHPPHLTSPDLTKTRRYWIDPKDLLAAQRYGRDRQLDVIGIYHSHPDHPAVPSECDRACAWPQYSYVIVSVQQGEAKDIRCWKLDEAQQFQPEAMLGVELPARSV